MDTQKGFVTRFGEWWDEQQTHRRQAATHDRPPRRLTGWLPARGNVLFTLIVAGLLVAAQTAGALPLARPPTASAAASTGTLAHQGRLMV